MNGPFRVNKPSAVAADGSAPAPPGDEWLTRLVKLVPAEVIAVYLAGIELAKTWPGIWTLVCLLLVILVRTVGTKQSNKPIQWIAVVVAAISYVIWVYATGGYLLSWRLPPGSGIASLAVLLWTFVVPYIYKGD
jgi:hypothetical protein